MNLQFAIHNSHLDSPEDYWKLDPQLRQLQKQKLVHRHSLLQQLPLNEPGIYSIGGSRQIGKSTLLKQWIAQLLKNGTQPETIYYFSGELIDNHHSLLMFLQNQIEAMPHNLIKYILLDEVTYISDWDKAIKYIVDAGLLENTILLITGSDLALMSDARKRFPGRRGKADIVDFHLYPLSFAETIELKLDLNLQQINTNTFFENNIDLIYTEFNNYLQHGGFLTAINDFASNNSILNATLMTYADWIRGDILKRNKQEHYLKEILQAIIKHYSSQITWNNLAANLSIDHPATVADYCLLLESMDAIFIQHAIIEDKLTQAPKKAKKLLFTDPFIYHAIQFWLNPVKNAYNNLIIPTIQNQETAGKLVESIAINHYKRHYQTYYIKGEAEVDIAYINKNTFWPIKIKWTNQLRAADLKQIIKYKNGKILTKIKTPGEFLQVPTIPLPLELLQCSNCW